ncbi:hypothetical protein [Botryobacter ruber]|uniref:hypothetical protein n=1 Tax=Botryobacter ruber TaxID=2171629 RepID=UPI000E0B8E72|nr:hypothetical protein [Botryobacter ruber]
MRKPLFFLLAAGLLTFASCDSPQENRQEETEDRAEETADELEDAAEETADETEDAVEDVERH